MKISQSIRSLYEEQLPRNERLKKRVDTLLSNLRNPRWHYESRIKDLESFALKIESGRFNEPSALEDFFACTLVVRSAGELTQAEDLANSNFSVLHRRPQDASQTHKRPDSFPFDDLRLYVGWKDDPKLPPTDLAGFSFELQIKTYLQHAWTIATHDLVYKTPEPHWGKQRIAFQVKAMLEHAEISIHEAEGLSGSSWLEKSTRESRRLTEVIGMLRALWPPEDLPTDLRRLAENVAELCISTEVDLRDVESMLREEGAAGRGAKTRNLSPFGIVLDSLFRRHPEQLERALIDDRRGRRPRIVVPAEVEIPSGSRPAEWKNALILRG